MIGKSYSDDKKIVEGAVVRDYETPDRLGLSTSENYYIWSRPIINNKMDTESFYVTGAQGIADSVNQMRLRKYYLNNKEAAAVRKTGWEMKHWSNPIAVFSIKTGKLMWHDEDQYNEEDMNGHGYDISVAQTGEGSLRSDTYNKWEVSINSVKPIVIIPHHDDAPLNQYNRIIVAIKRSDKTKSKSEIHTIVYANDQDISKSIRIGNSMAITEAMKVATFLYNDGHDLVTIARTCIQEEYVKQITGHIENNGTVKDISVSTMRHESLRLGQPEGYKAPVIKCTTSGLKQMIDRLGDAMDENEIWIDSTPVSPNGYYHNDQGKIDLTKLKTYRDFSQVSPDWLLTVRDEDDNLLFGFKFHDFLIPKFYIEFGKNVHRNLDRMRGEWPPIGRSPKNSEWSIPWHSAVYEFVKNNDALKYIVSGRSKTPATERWRAYWIIYQEDFWDIPDNKKPNLSKKMPGGLANKEDIPNLQYWLIRMLTGEHEKGMNDEA